MLVKKIYGSRSCQKCTIAKEKFKNAIYTDIMALSATEREILLEKARCVAQTSLPIMLDSKDEIISHIDAGM